MTTKIESQKFSILDDLVRSDANYRDITNLINDDNFVLQ